jgi:uncharacterized protein involved in exopolysaccharide biosynthesis
MNQSAFISIKVKDHDTYRMPHGPVWHSVTLAIEPAPAGTSRGARQVKDMIMDAIERLVPRYDMNGSFSSTSDGFETAVPIHQLQTKRIELTATTPAKERKETAATDFAQNLVDTLSQHPLYESFKNQANLPPPLPSPINYDAL